MGNIVACDGALPGYLTNSRHCFLQKISDWCDKGREIYQFGRRESSVFGVFWEIRSLMGHLYGKG
jgi:hypothetical protein